MHSSLSIRIIGLGVVVIAALVFLSGLLVYASHETSISFSWVTHSAEVIEETQAALSELRDLESSQRGFILTRDPAYAGSFAKRVEHSVASIKHVGALTSDNPLQHAKARALEDLMAQRIVVLRQVLTLGQRHDFAGATAVLTKGRGQDLMDAIIVRAQAFLDEENRLQIMRAQAAYHRLALGQRLAVIGAIAVGMLLVIGFVFLLHRIRRPLEMMMQAMTDFGNGEHQIRINAEMGSTEFARLAKGYNAMADQLQLALAEQSASDDQLQAANAELQRSSQTLRDRGQVIELLGGMAHRMQAARTDAELASIIQVFLPRVLPDIPGTLYAHNNSRNLLSPIASWGGLDVAAEGFAPDQCWALRRGQSHFVTEPGCDIVCGHAHETQIYHCEPLLASGEVIGILYLHGQIDVESRFRMAVLTENIASAMVNQRLQRSLREQTIRDPLTSLFNRRYMEETLKLEIARAARGGLPLSVVMCDVDHFKRFNDEFGHDGGDAVLQALAAEMRTHFRAGDVICRFGGEEFTIIAPGTTAEALMQRVEVVRHAISTLKVRHDGRVLGSTSMSFGIATWSNAMDKDGSSLVKAADAALYQAKRDGRNRATISRLAA